MSERRETTAHPQEAPGDRRSVGGDSVSMWLDMLSRLLRVPETEKAEIRSELESHLRDRTRDLMLAGCDEDVAAGRAIGELGEAAELAERFGSARGESKRRMVMSVTGIGLAAGAVVVSMAALLRQPAAMQPVPDAASKDANLLGVGPNELLARREPQMNELVAATLLNRLSATVAEMPSERRNALIGALTLASTSPATGGLRTSAFEPPEDAALARLEAIQLDLGQGAAVSEMVNQLSKQIKVDARLDLLKEIGVTPDSKITNPGGKISAKGALQLLNEWLGGGDVGVAVRLVDAEHLELATDTYFDRRETTLVMYDIGPIVQRREEDGDARPTEQIVQEVTSLITSLVYQNLWRENGGEAASISAFGNKLFIQAPRRFHPKIKWILDEMKAEEQQHADAGLKAPIRARDGVPVLKDIPLLNNNFAREVGVRDRVGNGPLIIRGCADGKVEIIGPTGTLTTSEVRIDGEKVEGAGAGAHRNQPEAMQGVALKSTSSSEVAEFLKACFGGGQVGTVIASAIDDANVVMLAGEMSAVERAERLTAIIDTPAPKQLPEAVGVEGVFQPTARSASDLRELLERAFNVSPGLKRCAVARIMEVNDGRLQVRATKDQIEVVGRIVELIEPGAPALERKSPGGSPFGGESSVNALSPGLLGRSSR